EKLACITGPKNTTNSQRRLKGFLDELSTYNLAIDKRHILIGDYTLAGWYECGRQLIDQDVTGVFAFNDLSAIGCMKAAYDCGKRVPENLSIIGYDNISMSNYTQPKLTSIDQNPREIATEAVEALVR